MNIFEKLNKEVNDLKKTTKWFNIGKSTLGRNIVCFELGGNGRNKIILQAGIHAREYITSFLLLKMIKYLSKFQLNATLFFVPISNPDGVDICINGSKNIKHKKQKKFINCLLKYFNKSLFKANANGVDINTNFDAMWSKGAKNELFCPGPENFVGKMPNSEKETKALINLTNMVNPNLTLSYHSKGEVVFWGFENQSEISKINQQKFLQIITSQTKYKPVFTKNSCGGYKDYCILKKDILSYTIEVGADKLAHPIGLKNLNKIFNQNKDVVLELIKNMD